MNPRERRTLQTALQRLKIRDTARVADQMDQFIHLIREWNQRINLISRQDEPRLLGRHLLESAGLVSAVSIPQKSRIADIGTGAGFPGLPLAMVRPDLQVTLIESKRKKILFLQKAIQTLGVENVQIIPGRIEETASRIERTDWVLSRAVTDLVTLCQWSGPLFTNDAGTLVALKGQDVQAELESVKIHFSEWAVETIPYHPFPDLPDTRAGQLICIRK